ncbi:UNVERIFIED_CONTAM: hypothetical protein FKN15_033507 [Acipenser sinensis]
MSAALPWLFALVLLASAAQDGTALFLPNSTSLQHLLSRYQDESLSLTRSRRAIQWSDREEILKLHNKLRGQVSPSSSNMEYRAPAHHVQAWYDEVKDYTYPYPQECNPWCPERCSGPMCTHYTQLVWATTNKVGCAVHVCKRINVWGEIWENSVYLVCNYSPKGNWIGEAPYQHGRPCSQCPPSYGGGCKENLCYKDTQVPQRPETEDMNEVEKPQVPKDIPGWARPRTSPAKATPGKTPGAKDTGSKFMAQVIKCETKMRDKCKGTSCNRYKCPANCKNAKGKIWGTLFYDTTEQRVDCYTTVAELCAFKKPSTHCPRVHCPPRCKDEPSNWAPVIGSNIYSDSSSICRSAIHAGLIKDSDGGYVDILPVDKKKHYVGTLKNGVRSER